MLIIIRISTTSIGSIHDRVDKKSLDAVQWSNNNIATQKDFTGREGYVVYKIK